MVFITIYNNQFLSKVSGYVAQKERNGILKGVSLGVSFCSYSG